MIAIEVDTKIHLGKNAIITGRVIDSDYVRALMSKAASRGLQPFTSLEGIQFYIIDEDGCVTGSRLSEDPALPDSLLGDWGL